MSTRTLAPLTQDEFTSLKIQLSNAKLTDVQITDLALILKDKWEHNNT